jgi:hypothetical protein
MAQHHAAIRADLGSGRKSGDPLPELAPRLLAQE